MAYVIELGAYPGGLRPRSIFNSYYWDEDKDFYQNFEQTTFFDTKYAAERAAVVELGYGTRIEGSDYELRFVEIPDEKLAKLYLQNDGKMVLSMYIR